MTDHPTLAPNQLLIFDIQLSTVLPARETEFRALLNTEEQLKVSRFVKPIDQQRALCARAALRLLLSQLLSYSPAALQFTTNAYGKPALSGSLVNALQFNVSHSGDWVIIAIAKDHPLGVDVEQCRDRLEWVKLTEQFASLRETEYLQQLPPDKQPEWFYQLWTAKEAIIKAIGKGFHLDTKCFSILCQSGQLRVESEVLTEPWELYSYRPAPDYQACLAHHAGLTPKRLTLPI